MNNQYRTIGRISGLHLEILEVGDGGVRVALCRSETLKAFARLGPREKGGEYFVNSVEGYCRADDPIDVHASIYKLLSEERFKKLVAD